jgi:F0F1-type ATP synthase delta subunit
MNADLNVLLQRLDADTQDYPAEQALNELRVVGERLTFAGIEMDNLAESPSRQKDVEFLLNHDISPAILGFIRYLMAQNTLSVLTGTVGQVFLDHCQTYFGARTQLTFKTAVGITDEKRAEIRTKLKTIYASSTRILFAVDANLVAGFAIEDANGKTDDLSLRRYAPRFVQAYLKQTVPRKV